MPPSSAAARSFALAVIGVGAASFAAQGQNVTAFNPYSGAGQQGTSAPQHGSPAASPVPDSGGPAPTAGPAFNPWSSRGQTQGAYDPGASLPPPPPGPIKSRIVAVPELTTSRGKPRDAQKATADSVATAVRPASRSTAPPVAAVPTPAPAPARPVAAAPSTDVPAAPPRQMAALAPAPSPPPTLPARNAAITVAFTARSTELSDASKAELDRLAKDITDRTLRQVELRTVADKGDPDSRKISLARALIVRNYLIDRGVRSRIEIASIVGDGGERVEILVPGT